MKDALFTDMDEELTDVAKFYLQEMAKADEVSPAILESIQVEKHEDFLHQKARLLAKAFVGCMSMNETSKTVNIRVPKSLADDFRKWQNTEYQHNNKDDMVTFTKTVEFEEGFTLKDIPENFKDAYRDTYRKTTGKMWRKE